MRAAPITHTTICDRVWENWSYPHINWNPVFVHKWKVHSCTTQKHQVLGNRWPGLLLQTAFFRCCKTTKVHLMVLGRVNRTAWGTKLLLTAVWASLVDCTSSRHLLKAHHCSLSPNGCFVTESWKMVPNHTWNPLYFNMYLIVFQLKRIYF